MSNQCWETPWEVYNALDKEFYFTLDGAADEWNHKHQDYISEEENAHHYVAHPGDVIFCNPGYQNMEPWVETFIRWNISGAIVVALHLLASSPKWMSRVWETTVEWRIVYPRIHFLGTKSSNPRDSAISIWKPGRVVDIPRVVRWTWK